MRTRLLLMVGGAALLAGCTVDSNYQPAAGYSEAPAAYQTYPAPQPSYQATYYQTYAPAPAYYPFYSPEGSPADSDSSANSK